MTSPNVTPLRPAAPAPAAPASPPANSPSKRGRPKAGQERVLPDIPADEFKIEIIPDHERGNYRRIRDERSDQQKAVDGMVMVVYRDWVAKGKAEDWPKMPVRKWPVSPQFEETARKYLAKACGLHGKKLINGRMNPAPVENGKVIIAFCVVDRKTKVENAPGGETEGDDS